MNNADIVDIAWVLASILLIIVFLFAWKMLKSFTRAFIAMLLIGKFIAGIYYFVGIDKPLFIIAFRNGAYFVVTVAESIFLVFLLTLFTTILVLLYGHLLPRELRSVLSVEEEGVGDEHGV